MSIEFCHSQQEEKKNLHITLGYFPAKRILQPYSQAAPLSHAEGMARMALLLCISDESWKNDFV